MAARGIENSKYQGSKWISRPKRLAIYMRDGMACAYCGNAIEDGSILTLDHITTYSNNGNNHETNLITACRRCNSSRGNRDIKEFAGAVSEYLNHGVQAEAIVDHVIDCASRPLDIQAAKNMIARRGSWAAVIERR